MEQQKLARMAGKLLNLLGIEDARGITEASDVSWWRRYNLLPYGSLAFGLLLGIGIAWFAAGNLASTARIGGKSYSLHGSDQALTASLQQSTKSYALTVIYPDGSKQRYRLSDMGFTAKASDTVVAIRAEQHSTMHRLMWWRTINETMAVSTNSHALHDFITARITNTVQPSQDATVSIVGGEVKISDATTGKQYGLRNPQVTLMNAATNLRSTPITITAITINPAVTAKELLASKTAIEHVLNQPVSFTIGEQKVTPNKNDIAAWLELTPNTKTKKVDVDVNSGKIAQYITKIAAKSGHPARDQVQITRDDGSTFIVVSGVNGVTVANQDVVATNTAKNLLSGKGIQEVMAVTTSPYSVVSTGDYPKWIEVDVTNKRMYAYEQTNLVKSFLVSAGAPRTRTVLGTYKIYSKYAQKDMRGNNVDGSKYFQPNVPWVNYFYRDYAIHGNYWRPLSYFGNINSSHGCVSIVPNEAAWIYDWAPIGTPVVIHT